jgi:putative membrane protein
MRHLLLFLKGLAMGATDVVPGVSGGTIAFITGIYGELMDSIKSINLNALDILRRRGPAAFWKGINGNFLLALGSGILLAILTLARGIRELLTHQPVLVWAFFLGLIVAACWHMGRQIRAWNSVRIGLLLLATVLAALISSATPSELPVNAVTLLLAGSIAICAMILPGISGSFMLVLMGMYTPVLAAVSELDLPVLALFATGAAIGLLSFTRLLSWLLHHHEQAMLALLTGFMAGSLVKVWPWKQTLLTRLDRHGQQVPVVQANIWPEWSMETLYALGLMLIGAMLVLSLERVARRLG